MLFRVKHGIIDGNKAEVTGMRRFNYDMIANMKWDCEVLNYISLIHEYRGKQSGFISERSGELEGLIEAAKVESTASSNSIEGIRTTGTRLKLLMSGRAEPRSRSEGEIAGYRDALNIIHESYEYIPTTANQILGLHKILMSHTDLCFGGSFKNVQNYISTTNEAGESYTLFTPPAPYETPEAVESICGEYRRALSEGKADPLLLIPIFIRDFLCIHPFLDGNGRMSRLLTTLLLYRTGYDIGKYISLEAKIEKSKDGYYSALQASDEGWYEGRDDPTPFVKYMLGVIAAAYRDLDTIIGISSSSSAYETVAKAVGGKVGKFTKSEIAALCPSLSLSSVERGLRRLTDEGQIERHGAGKGTFYAKR